MSGKALPARLRKAMLLADSLDADSMRPELRFDAHPELINIDFFVISKLKELIGQAAGAVKIERDLYADWHSKNVGEAANLLRELAMENKRLRNEISKLKNSTKKERKQS